MSDLDITLGDASYISVYAGATIVDAVVNGGYEFISSGATDSNSLLEGGARETIYSGGSAIGVTVEGATLSVYGGTLNGATITNGSLQQQLGTVNDVTVEGGTVNFYSGTVTDIVMSGVSGDGLGARISSASIAGTSGNLDLQQGFAQDFIVENGAQLTIDLYASAAAITVLSGATLIERGGTTNGVQVAEGGRITMIGGTISNLSLSSGGIIDFAEIVQSGATVNFVENGADTQGTLTITEGSFHSSVVLFGQYAANGFQIGTDGTGGTAVMYAPGGTPGLELAAARH